MNPKNRATIAAQVAERGAGMKGKTDMLKFLKGEPVTQRQAIQAKCYDCMGYFQDGANGNRDCGDKLCPLYPYNPNAAPTDWREKAKAAARGAREKKQV